MRAFRVRIARFPGGQSEHPAAAQWVIETSRQIAEDRRINDLSHWWVSDTPIPMLRNRCVRESLHDGIDYLLMIDRDMAPDLPADGSLPFWTSSWRWMMDRREQEMASRGEPSVTYPPATIAAPYCGPPADCYVYVWEWVWGGDGRAATAAGDVDGRWEKTPDAPGAISWVPAGREGRMVMVSPQAAATRRGIQPVAALPTGLILYDLRVFRRLVPPWFSYEYTDGYEATKVGPEDVRQTRRAGLLGMPQLCNWDAWAGHVKLGTVERPGAAGGAVSRPSGLIGDAPQRFISGVQRPLATPASGAT